jgi:hypothetical protein
MSVFCHNCRHYSSGNYGNYCDVPDLEYKDWYKKGYKTIRPEVRNQHNDCLYWQHKRGFIEWIIYLLGEKYES